MKFPFFLKFTLYALLKYNFHITAQTVFSYHFLQSFSFLEFLVLLHEFLIGVMIRKFLILFTPLLGNNESVLIIFSNFLCLHNCFRNNERLKIDAIPQNHSFGITKAKFLASFTMSI